MVPVDDTVGATIAVAGVIHQDIDPELGEVPDLEGYRQREGIRDVKLGDELPEDQRRVLNDLVRRYPDVFTDMPGETDVIQHQIRLTDDTPIRCKPSPLQYAMREELRNEVDTMLEMGVVRPSTWPYASPIVMVKKKQVRSFLGLVGYYRDHIPAFAEISAPLTDILKKGKAEHIQWSEAQERAHSLLKEYLLQEPVLKLPDLSKPFVLWTDASGVGVADVLLQENDGKLYPVGYASKKLNLTEARYPIIEKECLAVVWGIKRFKLYLAGRRFTLQTDHKPLKYLKEASYQNDRVFRWAVAVQEYSFRVEDIPGKENIGADFFSRTGFSC